MNSERKLVPIWPIVIGTITILVVAVVVSAQNYNSSNVRLVDTLLEKAEKQAMTETQVRTEFKKLTEGTPFIDPASGRVERYRLDLKALMSDYIIWTLNYDKGVLTSYAKRKGTFYL